MKMTASTSAIFLCLSVLLLVARAKTEEFSSLADRCTNDLCRENVYFYEGQLSTPKHNHGKREWDEEKPANDAKKRRKDEKVACQSHAEGEHSCNITPSNHQDAVNVNFEMVVDNGDYVLKIKMINLSSTDEDEIQRGKHMAQNGTMLLLYGKMLQDMGEKLIAQSQASIYSIFNMPTPPKLIHV